MKKFTRTIEDFTCAHCGKKVTGNGYTDHCPFCLWGKHVDINPGDRLADCQGAMKPVNLEFKSQKYIIHYDCQKCSHHFRVKANKDDDPETMLKIKEAIE